MNHVWTNSVLWVVGATLGCARARVPDLPATQTADTELFRLEPDTATIADGQIVVVRAIGRGFDATESIVEFGPVVLQRVRASATRDTLTFTVPLTLPSSGGAPPRSLNPGEYVVTVRIGNARTAGRRFRVLAPSAAAEQR